MLYFFLFKLLFLAKADYPILDLQGADAVNQASLWTFVAPYGAAKSYSCGSTIVLGGFQIAGKDTIAFRTYNNLPPHEGVYFEATVWRFDNWRSKIIFIKIDNSVYSTYRDPTGDSHPGNLCADYLPDLAGRYVITKAHTENNLTLSFYSDLDTDATRSSWGISDIKLSLFNYSKEMAMNEFFCSKDFVVQTNMACPCDDFSSYNFTTKYCQSCNPNFQRCAGMSYSLGLFQCNLAYQNCKTCGSTGCISCLDGYYISGGVCKPCDSKCTTCYGPSSSNCTSCASPYWLSNSTCCIKGTFWVNQTCSACNSACSTCNGTRINQCFSCNGIYYLNGTSCGLTCPVKTYANILDNTCTNCTSNCLDCNGTMCLTCSTGYFLEQNYSCTQCHPTCSSCTNANACSSQLIANMINSMDIIIYTLFGVALLSLLADGSPACLLDMMRFTQNLWLVLLFDVNLTKNLELFFMKAAKLRLYEVPSPFQPIDNYEYAYGFIDINFLRASFYGIFFKDLGQLIFFYFLFLGIGTLFKITLCFLKRDKGSFTLFERKLGMRFLLRFVISFNQTHIIAFCYQLLELNTSKSWMIFSFITSIVFILFLTVFLVLGITSYLKIKKNLKKDAVFKTLVRKYAVFYEDFNPWKTRTMPKPFMLVIQFRQFFAGMFAVAIKDSPSALIIFEFILTSVYLMTLAVMRPFSNKLSQIFNLVVEFQIFILYLLMIIVKLGPPTDPDLTDFYTLTDHLVTFTFMITLCTVILYGLTFYFSIISKKFRKSKAITPAKSQNEIVLFDRSQKRRTTKITKGRGIAGLGANSASPGQSPGISPGGSPGLSPVSSFPNLGGILNGEYSPKFSRENSRKSDVSIDFKAGK